MKRLLQLIGIRKWSGEDLISLQAEPLKTIDAFFATYGNCIFNGCEVSAAPGNTYNIAPGFVALQGKDQDNRDTFKVAPFAGLENATLPVYLTLSYNVIEKEYVDGKVKPVAYDYYAAVSSVRPTDVPYLEITASGGRRFIDAIGITRKLDKTGNGRDVTVTFNPAIGRENVSSGEKLTTILGKVARWFVDLKTVAFSGKTADLTDDANHRFTTDTEKVGWNDKYTKTETDNKDAATLTAAKNYTDVLDDKVYKKTETYTRAETDAKDTATLNTAKQYVLDRIAEIVGGSPAALDTLYEIAKALGEDPNFATSIMALVNGKAPLVHTHTKSQITDFPSSMPASDVYAWAKQPTKPTYNAGEVGAAPVRPFEGGEYRTQHKYENIAVDDTFLDSLENDSDNIVMNATITNNDLVIWNGDWLFRKSFNSTILAWNAPIELYWGFILKRSLDGHWTYDDDIDMLSLKKLNAKADKNHSHTADQISDTSTKVMMTAEERSKLSGIEIYKYLPRIRIKTREENIFVYHDKLPEQLMKLNPQIVMLRCKKVNRCGSKDIDKAWRWGEIRHTTIGMGSKALTDFFRFQLSNMGRWYLLKRGDNSIANIDELTKAFIRKTTYHSSSGYYDCYNLSFYPGPNNKWLPSSRSFVRSGTFALAIRIDNPNFPTSINGRPINEAEYIVDKIPRYLYSELAKFKLIVNYNYAYMSLGYSLKLI